MPAEFQYKVKTLVNELAPALVVMTVQSANHPLSAAEINANVTARFAISRREETIKLQPALIYNLLRDLVDEGLLVRDRLESTYTLSPKGRKFALSEALRALDFCHELSDFVRETLSSLGNVENKDRRT